MTPRTLFEKIWDAHVVAEEPERPAVLYVDLHLIHEVTSPQAFAGLRARGLRVRRPDRTFATMDHSVPTLPRGLAMADPEGEDQLRALAASCREHGIALYGTDSDRQGIVHVIGPELGLTLPGHTIVCGDSHTATHGAFGALAFGIGTSEVEHVLATQCLLQRPAKTLEVRVDGALAPGVSAKDIALALIARIGVGGATGHVIEYTGEAIRGLDMEGRMTVCNMSIEAGARAGMIAPDDVTFAYLEGRDHAPRGAAWQAAVARWRELRSDPGARFDRTVVIDGNRIEPMITFGTNPGMGIAVTGNVPSPADTADPAQRAALDKALRYMNLAPGEPLLGRPIDVVFIGSCTNSRITDLRAAAKVLAGRKVARRVRTLVVPGSRAVKRQAEREGLDRVFLDAGAEWRDAGCSMCIAMNGDRLEPGQYAVSTSNRNFEGRQGPGGRTFLASPVTAAASAITGRITDIRSIEGGLSRPPWPGEAGPFPPPRVASRGPAPVNPVLTDLPDASVPAREPQGPSAMPQRCETTNATAFESFESTVVALPLDDIDTDQIIPARYLKGTDKVGLGEHLFADRRLHPDFPLLAIGARQAQILVAGANFGCGSSREHAPWALVDRGFRAIIARSFADIFRQNATKNGLLPIALDDAAHAQILAARAADSRLVLRVDLPAQQVSIVGQPGAVFGFAIDPFAKHCLVNGVDELGYLLGFEDRITAHERRS